MSVLSSEASDVSAVRQLAISRSGLVTNDVRALAWPKLLNVDPNRKLRRRPWEELTRHRDYDQVVLDVRCVGVVCEFRPLAYLDVTVSPHPTL